MNIEFIHGGICAAVAAVDTGNIIAAVQPVLDQVDVVEIRLDAMAKIDIRTLCATIHHPLLFTNRPVWEGGKYSGPESQRVAFLLEAVQQGAAFVDLELKTENQLRSDLLRKIEGTNTRLILSSHNFENTPDEGTLSQTLKQQAENGAHIGKIVTMAHDHLDVLRVLNLQKEAVEMQFPLIAFCMGEAGKLSRIITLLLGGFMTYAALDDNQATAPGQLSIEQLKTAISQLH